MLQFKVWCNHFSIMISIALQIFGFGCKTGECFDISRYISSEAAFWLSAFLYVNVFQILTPMEATSWIFDFSSSLILPTYQFESIIGADILDQCPAIISPSYEQIPRSYTCFPCCWYSNSGDMVVGLCCIDLDKIQVFYYH